jgi:5-dehydro-2-deoxygluconokinase
VLDLDYRPMFWSSREEARRHVREALRHVTVAVGNQEECEVAVGTRAPRAAADALRACGVELAVVKQGPRGVLGKTRTERVVVLPTPVDVVNGLGAGDAFAAAYGYALLRGLDPAPLANAAGALVATRHACSAAMPRRQELHDFLASTAASRNVP